MTVTADKSADHREDPEGRPARPGVDKRLLLRVLLLVGAAVLVYLPALHGDFVWDDDVYLTANPLITAPDGLSRIWFSLDVPSQYFPLVYTSFRLEHRLWGDDPTGYHAVNIALHALNALLLWWILARMGIPAAWLAAGLFVLHPVQVESVAWITERKNCLSGFFSLAALALWVVFLESSKNDVRRRICYLASLACFLLALFAKTPAAVIPLVMLLLGWFRGLPLTRRLVGQVAPFLGSGAAMALVGVWWEVNQQKAAGPLFDFNLLQRLQIAGRSLWFSLGKLLWPANLSFSYARWRLDPADPVLYAGAAAAAALILALWWRRNHLGRAPLAAALFYALNLAPYLGFVPLYTFRYSYTADHYQYLACIGPLTLIAAGADRLWPRRNFVARAGGTVLALVLLAGLGFLSWRQAHLYQNKETLWQGVLAGNHGSGIALSNLGILRMQEGKKAEAIDFFNRALQADPSLYQNYANVGVMLQREGDFQEAGARYRQALAINPDAEDVRLQLGLLLRRLGRLAEAGSEFSAILARNPRNALAHFNLAEILLLEGDRVGAEAAFRSAMRLRPDYADAHYGLALLLAGSMRAAEAMEHFEAATATLPEAQRRRVLERAREKMGN